MERIVKLAKLALAFAKLALICAELIRLFKAF